jgi:hypothetical protein
LTRSSDVTGHVDGLAGIENREVAHGEAVAACEDLGNAPPVAHPPISLVAQQTARRRSSDFSGLLQVEFGLGAGELFLDDMPEPFPFAATARQAAFGRCSKRRQMNITHPGILDRRRELALREAGPEIGRSRTSSNVETPTAVRVPRTSFSSAFS